MTGGVVFNQLMAVKHQALALAQSIDLLIGAMNQTQASEPAPAAPVSPPAEESKPEGPCTHPMAQRIPLPVMGTKKRFKCMDCNADVEESE